LVRKRKKMFPGKIPGKEEGNLTPLKRDRPVGRYLLGQKRHAIKGGVVGRREKNRAPGETNGRTHGKGRGTKRN